MDSVNLPARFTGLSLSELDPSPAVKIVMEYVDDHPARLREGKGLLIFWRARRDLNPRQADPKSAALSGLSYGRTLRKADKVYPNKP